MSGLYELLATYVVNAEDIKRCAAKRFLKERRLPEEHLEVVETAISSNEAIAGGGLQVACAWPTGTYGKSPSKTYSIGGFAVELLHEHGISYDALQFWHYKQDGEYIVITRWQEKAPK